MSKESNCDIRGCKKCKLTFVCNHLTPDDLDKLRKEGRLFNG